MTQLASPPPDVVSDVRLAPVLAALTKEAAEHRLGASAVVTKIADVFLAQALRTWLLQREHYARVVLDDSVAKALHLLDSSASEPWSLDRLAWQVGLSRSALATAAFAKAFKRRFGSAPGAFRSRANEPPQVEIVLRS